MEENSKSTESSSEQMGMPEIDTTNVKVISVKSEVSFDDFMKLDVRLCKILSVEKVEKKDRLYKLKINTGFDERIVVSAIADIFKEEELLSKVLPFVLNLPMRKIAGIESYGMILLAEDKSTGQALQVSTSNEIDGVGAILI